MPGVGVAPGFSFRLASFGSGIPGVGVAPFGNVLTPFAGMPGVVFAEAGIGDVENSGGMLALLLELALTTTMFEFACGTEPHAKIRHEIKSKAISETNLYIKTKPQN